MKIFCRNAGNTDAGRLDGNDFGDVRSVETAAEFTPDLIQQRHIHLVVEKAVHLEDVSILDNAVFSDSVLKKLHFSLPLR